MRPSSIDNLRKCFRRYVHGSQLGRQDHIRILELGASDYRRIFQDDRFEFIGLDQGEAPGQERVSTQPDTRALEDGSVDIVVSDQAPEHRTNFALLFCEMVRVLKPDGLIFLVMPSASAAALLPVDRGDPGSEAYNALAEQAKCHVVETWLDERGPSNDLVGVFSLHPTSPVPRQDADPFADLQRPPPSIGTPEQEAVRGERGCHEVLADLHRLLQPAGYLEIGVRRGGSLRLAGCPAVGVDPDAALAFELGPDASVVAMTSDDFFESPAADVLPVPLDLVFLDGMHRFEYVLRDFMHVERRAAPTALVVVDDVLPNHPAQALRDRRTRVWAGDVWKLSYCLRRHRPDLFLLTLAAGPTGLLIIGGLDARNRTLWENYDPIVSDHLAMAGPPSEVLERRGAAPCDEALLASLARTVTAARRRPLAPAALAQALRAATAELVKA